ncbi:MAG: zinc-binding dehydrogenase [Myxococcales bacterium]|nr:zinc-binding dehydrogenase [Myxococcales bacterium]
MNHSSLVLQKHGFDRVLVATATPPRPPGRGEVEIAVAYSGVNFADVVMRLGMYQDAPPMPFVPGYELSGTIAAVGEGVTGFAVGDRVMAGTYFGGYTSRATLPAANVFPLPAHLTLREGAALPVSFFTAHMAFGEMARVRRGDRVLLDAATGGVGVIATKLAVAQGATVVGLTTSPSKKAFIEALGATAYTHAEFDADASIDRFDVILNAAGGASIKRQSGRLAIGGRIVCIGMGSAIVDGKRSMARLVWMALQTPRASVLKLFGTSTGIFALNVLTVMRDEASLKRLTAAFSEFAAGDIRPHIGAVVPWRDVDAALDMLAHKQTTGKVLLQWDADAPS